MGDTHAPVQRRQRGGCKAQAWSVPVNTCKLHHAGASLHNAAAGASKNPQAAQPARQTKGPPAGKLTANLTAEHKAGVFYPCGVGGHRKRLEKPTRGSGHGCSHAAHQHDEWEEQGTVCTHFQHLPDSASARMKKKCGKMRRPAFSAPRLTLTHASRASSTISCTWKRPMNAC